MIDYYTRRTGDAPHARDWLLAIVLVLATVALLTWMDTRTASYRRVAATCALRPRRRPQQSAPQSAPQRAAPPAVCGDGGDRNEAHQIVLGARLASRNR